MNTKTHTQRHNERQDKIWERCKQLKATEVSQAHLSRRSKAKAEHSPHENGEHCPACFNAGYDSGVMSHKASADKLAEALRMACAVIEDNDLDEGMAGEYEILTDALADYERAQ